MDILKRSVELLSKYRYVVLILAVGVVLMLLPTSSEDTGQTQTTTQSQEQSADIKEQLTQLLSQIQGVGQVQVMLTVQTGKLTEYHYDQTGENLVTVTVTDADRAETALVRQITAETYRGAVVVCQGADSAVVRLRVVEAVSRVTGLGADQISVLKMK